eukprot:9218021-Alexandrium_andersonii.AAC.1
MSASLVGSEMCIRDRDYAQELGAPDMPNGRLNGPRRAAGAHVRPSRAVSYTHLTLPTICSV